MLIFDDTLCFLSYINSNFDAFSLDLIGLPLFSITKSLLFADYNFCCRYSFCSFNDNSYLFSVKKLSFCKYLYYWPRFNYNSKGYYLYLCSFSLVSANYLFKWEFSFFIDSIIVFKESMSIFSSLFYFITSKYFC